MGRDNADERSVALAHIDNRILLIRDRKVLLDADLAALYGVQTRVLNQAVKRNRERFPADFMFRLSAKEFSIWRSQSVISNSAAKMALRRPPFAFTEHGALMAATVLNSPRAIQASLYVVRAFIRLRDFLASHADIARTANASFDSITSMSAGLSPAFSNTRFTAGIGPRPMSCGSTPACA